MSTMTISPSSLELGTPAQRLRRLAAAVRVSFKWWGTHRTLSTQQKEEVSDAYGADARLFCAGKRIIDTRHEAFRRLTSIRTRVVSVWRVMTLPYVEPGIRLIRQSDIEGFVLTLHTFRDDLAEAEQAFDRVFDQIKEDARKRLGKLYDATDYPPRIEGLFDLEWDFPSIEPPNYLMRLHPEIYREEQQRVAQRFEEAVRLAEQAFLGEFAKLVGHLTERLAQGESGEKRIFRDSVIANLTEFFAKFRDLNIQSNPELDRLVEQAQELVRGVTPRELLPMAICGKRSPWR